MKATFFKTSANLKPVFGILEPVSTLQMQIQVTSSFLLACFGSSGILIIFLYFLSFFSLSFSPQNLHAEVFDEFNRIDTEISFGAALAKATDDIARATNLEGSFPHCFVLFCFVFLSNEILAITTCLLMIIC